MLQALLKKMTKRQVEAWGHRSGGLTYGCIGRRMGISKQRVHQLIGEVDQMVHMAALNHLKVLTPSDVAVILRVSVEMVRKLIRTGGIKSFKLVDSLNSSVRIRQIDLQKYIDNRCDTDNSVEDMFTAIQVSEMLDMSLASVYALIREGKLKHADVGPSKGIRIPMSAIENLIK